MNTTVIPETELEAQDLDKDDILFYTLQEVTPVSVTPPPLHQLQTPPSRIPPLCVLPGSQAESRPLPPQGANNFFSLVGTNLPALRLDQPLDFSSWQNITFRLLVRVSRPGCSGPHRAAPGPGPPGLTQPGPAVAGHTGGECRAQPHGHSHLGPEGGACGPSPPLVPALWLFRPLHLHQR